MAHSFPAKTSTPNLEGFPGPYPEWGYLQMASQSGEDKPPISQSQSTSGGTSTSVAGVSSNDNNATANGNHWGAMRYPRWMGGYFPRPGPWPVNPRWGYPPPPNFATPPQQNFYNQRKPRAPWNMRGSRLPQFMGAPDEAFQQWPPPTAGGGTEEDASGEEPAPKKKKRTTNGTSRPWNREAAEKALAMEAECQKNAGSNAIVIRFPDPELSKEIVQKFHPSIENVHFQAPCGARYCFVTLGKDANVDKVMTEINKIKFGVGNLVAERKVQKTEENVGPENIDPFTLYVGNLPTNISTLEVKEKFPTATRIDVGYAQKMKYTRYAFVRYSTAEAALEAYKASVNTVIASRSIILRFRRHKAPVGPPGEKPAPSTIETKPGEKLTVGAKLKAKREKAKAEKALKEMKEKKIKTEKTEASEDEEDVPLEDDDIESEVDEYEDVVDDDSDEDNEEEDEDEEPLVYFPNPDDDEEDEEEQDCLRDSDDEENYNNQDSRRNH